MRQLQMFLLVGVFLLAMTGIALSQQGSADIPPSFEFVRQIGEELPRGVEYDPNFDQLALVDAVGRLLLVDARTFQTRHVLYETGSFYAYQFSHDGRWLAVAVNTVVEVWDTQTAQRDEVFDPGSALSFADPLLFSEDDQILLVTTNALAPDDIRRSENDTATLTWLWDIGAQRGERQSILRESTIASPFFDQRNQLFALGPNNRLLATRVDLIQILELTRNGYPQLAAIETFRSERDPADVWFSQRGDQMYFRPLDQSGFYQIDTSTDAITFIPTGSELGALALAGFDSLVLSDQARIIGQPAARESNSFLRMLLGDDYRRNFNDHPLTVMLVDILKPITLGAENFALLLYIADEQTGRGYLDVIRPVDAVDIALHPDGRHLAVRRLSGEGAVEIYDMDSGILTQSIVPTYRDEVGRHLLAFNADGSEIISHFQRFDVATGDLISQDLTYHPGFEQFFFSDDSRSIITRTGSSWWQWEIASGEVLRRETVNLRGEVLRVSLDDRWFLSRLDTEQGTGIELVDVGADERRSLMFDALPDRSIEQIIIDDTWENYLVVYAFDPASGHFPGNEIALYNLYDGLRWIIAGADLPDMQGREYGWTDDGQVYVSSIGGDRVPERIYGLNYHPSGLPQCLVDAFPEQWTRWTDLWEQLNNRLTSDGLWRLTQKLCNALPGTIEDVEDVFFPTSTPTRIPVSPTPSFIAGVPACLTAAYPGEGLQYAQEWRDLVADLPPERIAELESLLCQGLEQGVDVPPGSVPFIGSDSFQVMLIDPVNGARSRGTFLPSSVRDSLDANLVLQEFIRTEGYEPFGAALSPDTELFAVFTPLNHVAVYRLIRPYSDLVADITATAQANIGEQPTLIAIAPTATAPFERLGLPRPTLTPTVTLTPPPPPAQQVEQANYGEVVELCDTADTLYTVSAPPLDYAPSGRLLARDIDTGGLIIYDARTGGHRYDENIIDPQRGQLSFDQNWVLLIEDSISVARADGSARVVLFEPEELSAHPDQVYWRGAHTVEYVYRGYLPDQFSDAVTLIRRYNAATGELSEPSLPDPIFIPGLPTNTLALQPGDERLALVTTEFNAGRNTGYKFYIYDRESDTADYFARLSDGSLLEWEWHPLGRALYYRYPGEQVWYIFDAQTRQHRRLGDLPSGLWSRDGRYRARWSPLSSEDIEDRVYEGRPISKLSVWDSETGLTRRYCIPQTDINSLDAALYWSPDSRYLAFQLVLPEDANREIYRPRTLLLDLGTGSVTEVSFDISQIAVWLP